MAINSTFRTLAYALRGTVTDTYALLSAADAVTSLVDDLVETGIENYRREFFAAGVEERRIAQRQRQNLINLAATTCESAMDHFNDSKKINAIKDLRPFLDCGLKEAKDAVESRVFADAAARHALNKGAF